MYIDDFIDAVSKKLPDGFEMQSKHEYELRFIVKCPDLSQIDISLPLRIFDDVTLLDDLITTFLRQLEARWAIETL